MTETSTFNPQPRPLFHGNLFDKLGHVDQRQESEGCSDFELRLADCLEAYGYPKAEEKCLPYLRDLRECLFRPKQLRRSILMKQERDRQFKAGERKVHYEKAPIADSY